VARGIPACDDVPYISAPASSYVGRPSSLDDEEAVQQLQSWAAGKPGFEDIWLDRADHDGWITLAFSTQAAQRQDEMRAQFPDIAAVAVSVDWTSAELTQLQQRVVAVFRPQQARFAIGVLPNKGVVSIDLPFLYPDLVALAEQQFAGARVCLSGDDPANAPVEGPQPTGGNGWRLLADEDEVGAAYRTGSAYDDASYQELWRVAGLPGPPAAVDFENEVAIWFGAVHGSSCPRLRLDDVVVDLDRSLVHGTITYLDVGVCTADAIPHAYVVALDRARLPAGPFAIQLGAEDPPPGATEERTLVDADLSQPGSVARPDQIRPPLP
jgi:hypothetical protein